MRRRHWARIGTGACAVAATIPCLLTIPFTDFCELRWSYSDRNRTSLTQGPAKQPVGCRLQWIAVRMACTSQDPLRPWRCPETVEWRRNPRMSDLLREKNKRLILQELTAEIAFHEKRKSAR